MKPFTKEMIAKAEKIVCEEGNRSVAYLQRKLMIGYNRASELMEYVLRTKCSE